MQLKRCRQIYPLLFALVFTEFAVAQKPGIRLQNIGIERGLSQSTIKSFLQDSRGYMWFGTEDGLNRYDGYDIKIYKNDPDDSTSIQDSDLRCLVEDEHKRLWIGSGMSELGYLDLVTEKFVYLSMNGQDAPLHTRDMKLDAHGLLWAATWNGLYWVDTKEDIPKLHKKNSTYSKLRALNFDDSGILWIGTEEKGLLRLTGALEEITAVDLGTETSHNRIYCVLPAKNDDLLLGVNGGLIRYNKAIETSRFTQIQTPTDTAEVTALIYDRQGTLWIATTNTGLVEMDEATGDMVYHTGEDGRSNSLSTSGILSLYLDSQGLLWVGTRGYAVQFFDPETPFKYYGPIRDAQQGLLDPSIRAITGNDNVLWVGGYSGLNRFDRRSGVVTSFGPYPKPGGLGNKNIYALNMNPNGSLWIGTEGGGLYLMEEESHRIQGVPFHSGVNLEADHIYEFLALNNNVLLVGTGDGLYEIKDDPLKGFTYNKIQLGGDEQTTLDGEDIIALMQSSDETIWVGTSANGIYRLNSDYSLLEHLTRDRKNQRSISNNRIKSIFESNKGQVWIGTNGGGLNRWNPEELIFDHFDENDGLPDNTIYGIMEDDTGALWVSTNKGLARFDPASGYIQKFGTESGLQSTEFNTGAFYKSSSGEMFFGGIQGLNGFFPEQVSKVNTELSVSLTGLLVSNQLIAPGSALLPRAIDQLEEIMLNYNERIITFEFSAMNFKNPMQTQYRYQLVGATPDWIYTAADNRKATFTTLPQGRHKLQIQARSNANQAFGPAKELLVIVQPAPWSSWWARVGYLLVLLFVLKIIRKNELKKIELRKELDYNKQEAKKLNEMDEMKSRLISNVSHELRTPLTLLGGHIENLSESARNELTPRGKQNLQAAQNSLERVTVLSDQLFELARFASGKITLSTRRLDLVTELKKITGEFQRQSTRSDRKLEFIHSEHPVEVYLDLGKLEQILFNLLSNAMKFSHPHSTITIELLDDRPVDELGLGNFALVRVSNFGQGIPPSALTNIFERLYQIDSTGSSDKGGAGIGLALVKELVELHGGGISVESEPEGKTIFEFTIPRGSDHLSINEIQDAPKKETPDAVIDNTATLIDPTQLKILVVEDDKELRNFIKEGLENEYTVILAEDGVSGYAQAQKELPDLILSDLNMPQRDGLQLLKNVREDLVLSHVPVILLTGQTAPQDRVRGYAAMANDYIDKPFKLDELKVRITSIIRSRQQLILKLKNEDFQTLISESKLSRTDDRLLLKLKEVIDTQMNRSDLTVETLAKEVFMSKRQLERKLKDLTGQSPADLIRQIRLQTARKYLMDGSYATVAEISFAVGFKNVKYFSRLYRNQFDKSPNDILKN